MAEDETSTGCVHQARQLEQSTEAEDDEVEDGYRRFPDLVLDEIFDHLSFKDLVTCSSVCRQWRDKLSWSSRWHSLPLGFNVNCHADFPSVHFATTHIPRISVVTLTASVPFFVSAVCGGPLRVALAGKFTNLSPLLVDDVLTHGSRLDELDMSAMQMGEDCELAVEDAWSRVAIRGNQLSKLAFPRKFALTGDHLKYVFEKHPRLEHLSLSTAADDVTSDEADHPFGVFNSLKSLRLDIDQLWPTAVMKLLSLRSCYQLESLAVTKSFYLIDQEIFGPRMEKDAMTCLMQLTLMGSLVHLHLGIALTYVDVAVVLFNCCKLETLKIDYVDSDRGSEGLSRSGVRGLSLSANDVPQRLVSASFGLVPSELLHGFGGLLEMLSMCQNLTDVAIFPQSESGEVPIELIVSPTQFSTQLATEPAKWLRLTSFFFHLPTREEWRHLRTILPKMPNLRKLYLLVDAEYPEEGGAEGLALDELATHDDDATRHIQTLHLRISNSQSLLYLDRVLAYWSSVADLSVSIPYGELLMDDVDFYDFLENTPSNGCLERVSLYIPPLSLENKPDLSSTMGARLRYVKILTLPVVQFGPMSFEKLVALCPFVETFKVGDGADFYSFNEQMAYKFVSGLGLIDLAAISGWKWLKDCLLFVDVDDHAIESIPSVEDRPPAPFRDFAETFVKLKDADLIPRLEVGWKTDLKYLERIEVIASIYVSPERMYRPLIFAAKCGFGQLHFTS